MIVFLLGLVAGWWLGLAMAAVAQVWTDTHGGGPGGRTGYRPEKPTTKPTGPAPVPPPGPANRVTRQ